MLRVLFFGMFLIMFFIAGVNGGEPATITGDKNPEIVKDALKVLNDMPHIKADFNQILLGNIVIVNNIERFCLDEKCTDKDLQKLKTAKAFTKTGLFPIYIVREKNDYNKFLAWEEEYDNYLEKSEFSCKYPDIVYSLVSLIGHELIHKQGIADERFAYERQKSYNKLFSNKGCMDSVESKVFLKSTILDEQVALSK